jgi:hypothetical protein
MKKLVISAILFISVFFVSSVVTPGSGKVDGNSCSYKGIRLHGRVKIVTSFPDLKVQVVSSFPDLKVKHVSSFPDSCGEWQFVTSFPDFKIQYVTSFPDIKIQFVESFPGIP